MIASTKLPHETRIMGFAGKSDFAVRGLLGCVVSLALVGGQTGLTAAETELGRRAISTDNFVIRSQGSAAELNSAAELEAWGRRCEALLTEVRAKWFGETAPAAAWSPRCEVVVHGALATYTAAVPGGERTVASSWVEATRDNRIVVRRIDVRSDCGDWFSGALAHELIHVLLAERFGLSGVPRWAEEGLALLADPSAKQQAHDVDFRRAAASGGEFRLVELFAAAEYPSGTRRQTFYGQSASVVRYLVERQGSAAFVRFIAATAQWGHDAALRDVYACDGVGALELQWRQSLRQVPAMPLVPAAPLVATLGSAGE